MKTRLKILVVGQTPPPFHGQAIMIQMLVDGPIEDAELIHLRMAFSDSLDEVGRFKLRKIFHLIKLILSIYWIRIRHNPSVLYYPPTGPNRVPLIRDTILLICTRWLFKWTVFHFQASGVSELIRSLSLWQQFIVWQALGTPDAAIQLSSLTVSDASFLKAKRQYLIPNAAEDHAKERVFRKDASAESFPQIRLLYLGTVCETKGVLVLIDAIKTLTTSLPKVHLDIVGGFQPASFKSQVLDRIKQLELQSQVTLHGQRTGDAKWKFFANADVFCFPTYYESEGFPCVLVEAMSFSLPIVSTNWRGIPSMVRDGETGFLVAPRDVESLSVAIERLVENTGQREAFGRLARLRYEAEFTRSRHLQLMSEVFRNLPAMVHAKG